MAERTAHLSEEDAETHEECAQEHGLTVDEVVQRFVASLRRPVDENIHPDVRPIPGLMPPDVVAEDAYERHKLRKHGS